MPAPAPLVQAEEQLVVVGIGSIAGTGPEQPKSRGRKRKQPNPVPTGEPSPSPVVEPPTLSVEQERNSLQTSLLLVDLNQAIGQVLEQSQEIQTQLRGVREEIQSAVVDLEEIKKQSRAVRQDLQETERSLGGLRRTLQTTGEDLAEQFRAARDGSLELQLLRAVETRQPVESVAQVREELPSGEPALEIGKGVSSPAGKRQLGITVDEAAMIVEVLPETRAERAGLQPGDVVVGVGGRPVLNSEDLRAAIEQTGAGEDVHLTVARGQEKEEVKAQLAETRPTVSITGEGNGNRSA
jgi:C-terminal processing protease CtpA/Prc